jgi:hypothetical protein
MPKSCQDMEDIIRILIDMLYAKNVEFDTIMDTVRKAHYCIFCMQHYKGCDCDFSKVAISSDSECEHSSNHSTVSVDDDYTSSESESGSEKSESGSEDDPEGKSESKSEKSNSEESESESTDESPRNKEDDIFINNIINKNMSPMNIKLDDPASSSSEESGSEGDSESE